jgi:hypothetical protein
MEDTTGDKVVAWIGGATMLGLALFFVWPVFETMRGEITVYNLFCTKERVNGACKGEEQTANPTSFKVYADQQSVVSWVGDGPVMRYEQCAARDVSNWSCQNGHFKHIMANGEYTDTAEWPFLPVTTTFYPAPRYRWWWLKLSEMVSNKPK